MKKYILLCVVLLSVTTAAFSQLLTWSPQFPTETSTITITVDATKGNQGLQGVTTGVYMHLGVLTNLSSGPSPWKYVPATCVWGSTTAPAAQSAGTNKWSFTITNPRAFFGVPNGETIQKIAVLFRDANSNASLVKKQANTDGSDMYVPLYPANASVIQITTPAIVPSYLGSNETITTTAGSVIPFTAVSSVSGDLKLNFNGTDIASATGTTISGNITAVAGSNRVIASLNGAAFDTLDFFVSIPTVTKVLPAGLKDGINYYNCTDSVTLVLYAPNKTSSMLIGDFPGSNWTSQAQYQMNKTPDGNYFWLTIHGLTSGTEYAYQYLVDNSIYIADGFAEKYLSPGSDPYINPNSYPNLKPYPTNANVSSGTNGTVSVLQICAPQYNWTTNSFTKPDKKNLIIYELLVRDFSRPKAPVGTYDSVGNYQAIIDSIGYFKRLGINAIEFMPLQEFSGNISWGYNPNYYFAPDKVYGTKNKLKELIDTLHKNGIAVILDVVYNHLDSYNTPFAKLYWDAANSRPAANNPWLNPTTPHSAYKFFEDFNHTSAATQNLVKTSLDYWVNEYKVDGFRFDFTKGFTQTVTTGDNSSYDQSRIDNLNRYWDYLSQKHPNDMPYMILEHFCAASEENVLINKGFMPWREMFYQYKESLLGSGNDKNFGPVVWNYGGTSAPTPSLVGFMDSHDKERLVYECVQNGLSSGSYNVKNLNTALDRMEGAATVFFTVPGPKMIWQFDEFGYDIPRANNTDMKSPHWEYLSNANRAHLLGVYQKLIQFRLSNPAIFNNTPIAYNFSGYVKTLQIGDPVLANTQVSIVANLGLTTITNQVVNFQKTGNWYNYISNGTGTGINGTTNATFSITNTAQTMVLQPGEYHVYVSVPPCTSATPTVVTPISYCQNSTAQPLTATGSGLLWYTSPTTGTGVATLTPSTVNSGSVTYYVTQTTGGCSESVRVPLVVNITAAPALPDATVTEAPTCIKPTGTITVTAPTGSNIRYSKDGADYSNTNGVFTGLTNNTTYNITAKDINTNCISLVKSVAVPAIPGAPAAPQVNIVQATCTVSTATITITSDKTGLTFSSDGTNYTNTNGVFTITAGAAYSITAKNISGCVSTPTAGTLQAQPLTPAAPVVDVTQPTCTSATATITVTSDKTGLTFSSDGTNYTNTSGVFTIAAGAAYSITAKNTPGCISSARTGTVNVQPNVPGALTATVTEAPTCIKPTGTITVTAPTGTNIRYSIDGVNYTNANGIFTGLTNNTTYNITAKDINSTCVSAVKSVIVPAIPGAPAAPQVNITEATCTVATATITVTSDKTGLTFSNDGLTYTNTNGVFGNLTAGAAYSITAKNSSGCVSSPTAGTLQTQPVTPTAPQVNVTQPTCASATAIITVTSDKTGLTFSNDGISYTNTNGVFNNVAASTSYSITAKNTAGCISPAKTGTTNAQPNVPVQPTASVTTNPTCLVQTGIITVTAPTGSNIRYSIDGTDYTNTTGVFAGLTANTAYSITAKDINSTCASVVRSITVPAVPSIANALQLNITQPSCTVSTGTITVTSDKTGLIFSNDGVNYTNTNGVFNNISASSPYSITAKNTIGCTSPAATGTLNAQPIIPQSPTGLNTSGVDNISATLLWQAAAGAASYTVEYKLASASTWTTAAVGITSLSKTITGLTANSTYDWRVKGNCDINTGGEFATGQFITKNDAHIGNIKDGLGIAVCINPVTVGSKIVYIVPQNGQCSIVLYNSYGQKIKVILNESVTTGQQHTIPMADFVQRLSNGTYFLKIKQGGISNYTKFIKP